MKHNKHVPQEVIDVILERIDLVEVIQKRISLKKAGRNYQACCPFHNEKTPSFSVSPQKQLYHCFGCGESGNAITFLMRYERASFLEAVQELAMQAGIAVTETKATPENTHAKANAYAILDAVAQYYQQQLIEPQAHVARHYLLNRGISPEMSEYFRLGYAPRRAQLSQQLQYLATEAQLQDCGVLISHESQRCYERFQHRLTFPIRDVRGHIVGFGGRVLSDEDQPKYLNSPETAYFHKGKLLYGLFEALQRQKQLTQVIIVEGYMDVISLVQQGVPAVVATLGTATQEEHYKLLFRYTQNIVCCFDGDRAGQQAAWRALTVALPLLQDGVQFRFAFLPAGEDPDSFVRRFGKHGFLAHIEEALPLADFLIQHLAQEVDLRSLEGRARLAKLAEPHISAMPQGLYKNLVEEQLARLIRVNPQQLRQMGTHKRKQYAATNQQSLPPSSLHKTPMRWAIALLLYRPSLALTNLDYSFLQHTPLAGSDILYDLIQRSRAHQELNTASFLEQLSEHPSLQYIRLLANWDIPIPEEGLVEEWQDTLKHLLRLIHNHKIDDLIAKANQGALSGDERQELSVLIRQKEVI